MLYPNAEIIFANRRMSEQIERLPFHVLAPDSEHIASTKCPEESAMLIACLGDGYSLQHKGETVWREGQEDQPAGESYDHFTDVVYGRIGA